MLSRLALRPCVVGVRAAHTTAPAATPAAAAPAVAAEGERDLVNFPRRKPAIDPSPVRMGFVPQGWFDMLYPKTGVTGPYVLGLGAITFMMSKEFYVVEHETYSGIIIAMIIVYAVKKFGPMIAANLDEHGDTHMSVIKSIKPNAVAHIKGQITAEETLQEQLKAQAMLMEAKKENIAIQLETAYREHLQHVHSEVKKRLDFQLEVSGIKNRFEQKHMADWIVDNVHKSISASHKSAILKQCIVDLKGLVVKA